MLKAIWSVILYPVLSSVDLVSSVSAVDQSFSKAFAARLQVRMEAGISPWVSWTPVFAHALRDSGVMRRVSS